MIKLRIKERLMDQLEGDCSKDKGVLKRRNRKKEWWRNKSVRVYDLKKTECEKSCRN